MNFDADQSQSGPIYCTTQQHSILLRTTFPWQAVSASEVWPLNLNNQISRERVRKDSLTFEINVSHQILQASHKTQDYPFPLLETQWTVG